MLDFRVLNPSVGVSDSGKLSGAQLRYFNRCLDLYKNTLPHAQKSVPSRGQALYRASSQLYCCGLVMPSCLGSLCRSERVSGRCRTFQVSCINGHIPGLYFWRIPGGTLHMVRHLSCLYQNSVPSEEGRWEFPGECGWQAGQNRFRGIPGTAVSYGAQNFFRMSSASCDPSLVREVFGYWFYANIMRKADAIFPLKRYSGVDQ